MTGSPLAVLLRDKKDLLVQRWNRRVIEDATIPSAARLRLLDVCDHVPRLIDQLLGSMSGQEPRGEADGRSIGRSKRAWEHARLRVADRYSLAEALRELSHLRLALIDVCAEGVVALPHEESTLIHAAIDESMITIALAMEQAAGAAHEREVAFRDRFMGVLGHDLRNPLSCVTFTAESLLARADAPPAYERALSRIAGSAHRMERLIADLLDLTRMHGGGGIPITRRPTELASICRQVIEELEAVHPTRAIQLVAKDDGAGRWDPDRLAQLVSNLIGNALDYSPAEATVRVMVQEQGASALLEVNNLGAPIDTADLEGLFEPFRRGATGVGRAPRGLGLGLFIAKQIVVAHDGSITVKSDAGEGTTFTVRLPRCAPELA